MDQTRAQDLNHLLRSLLFRWEGVMNSQQYREAAYISNDIEACAHHLTTETHKIHEAYLANSKALNLSSPDPSLPPKKGD